MAAKKFVLKTPETGNLTSFADLMGKFGAIPKGVERESARVESEPTPTPIDVDLKSTRVDYEPTHNVLSVELQSTQYPLCVEPESTCVELQSTRKPLGVDSPSTPSIYWYSQNRDFYLIGIWHVLSEILETNVCTVTLRPLAKKLGMDASFLYKILKRLDASGMIRLVSQKEGSIIEILNPVWTNSPHEEEEVFKNKPLPHKRTGRNFQKEMETREALRENHNEFLEKWQLNKTEK
jgi:predicted transcriptional regulator